MINTPTVLILSENCVNNEIQLALNLLPYGNVANCELGQLGWEKSIMKISLQTNIDNANVDNSQKGTNCQKNNFSLSSVGRSALQNFYQWLLK